MAGNGWKLLKLAGNCLKWLNITENCCNRLEMAGNGFNDWKWLEMTGMARNC